MEVKNLNSPTAPEPVGHYPHAKKVGSLLFLSGVGPRKKGSKTIPGVELNDEGRILSYDIKVQCLSTFENVKTILEEAGSCWENLVDVTVFLTNMKKDFATYNQVYKEFFQTTLPVELPLKSTLYPHPLPLN